MFEQKSNKKIIFQLVIISCFTVSTFGMPGNQHINGTEDFGGMNDIKFSQDGSPYDYCKRKTAMTTTWMDQPARKIGKYKVNKGGGKPLTPGTHDYLRHNPENVSRALSGKGKTVPYLRDLARTHKIQDVFHNKVLVDGWEITPEMRKEADSILRYLKKYKKLPRKLPTWVDAEGPWITSKFITPTAKSEIVSNAKRIVNAKCETKFNGWPIDGAMKKKATSILRYKRRYNKLPKSVKIPKFLYSGLKKAGEPNESIKYLIKRSSSTIKEVKFNTKRSILKSSVEGAVKVIGIPIIVSTSAIEMLNTEQDYMDGDIGIREKTVMTYKIAAQTGLFIILEVLVLPLDLIPGGFVAHSGAFVIASLAGDELGEFLATFTASKAYEEEVAVYTSYYSSVGDFSCTVEDMKIAGFQEEEIEAYTKAKAEHMEYMKAHRSQRAYPRIMDEKNFYRQEELNFLRDQIKG